MADFYKLQEVIEKLGKTEAEIKDLVKEGKLREFRDGANLLFKPEEVDKLADELEGLTISAADEVEKADAGASEIELSLDETNEIGLLADDTDSVGSLDDGLADLDLTSLGDLTKADTNVGTTGISVLGDTDDDYKLASDTKGETMAEEEAGDVLGSLDDDMNMESVGSGSGLLDLSLQADDTSLGAVLDDILPAAGDEPEGMPGADMDQEADQLFDQPAEVPATTPAAAPMPTLTAQPRQAGQYFEPEPTGTDKICGVVLFIPLFAVIFTSIVIMAVFRNIMPSLVQKVQGPMFAEIPLIWVIVLGLIVLVLLMLLIGAAMGGSKKKKNSGDIYQQPA